MVSKVELQGIKFLCFKNPNFFGQNLIIYGSKLTLGPLNLNLTFRIKLGGYISKMENFRRSPIGLSLADRFRRTMSPKQKGTQALSDIQANLPTKIVDDQNENQTETRSEPQPDSNIQKKKIIPELSPQTPQTPQRSTD